MACEYAGKYKAVREGWCVSKLYCAGHVLDWCRRFPDSRLVEPRNIDGSVILCQADWPLPGEVPYDEQEKVIMNRHRQSPLGSVLRSVVMSLTPHPYLLVPSCHEVTLTIQPRCVFRPTCFVVRRLARKANLLVTEVREGNLSLYSGGSEQEDKERGIPLWELHRDGSLLMSTIRPEQRSWIKIYNPGPRATRLALDVEGVGYREGKE